mmetsp:Transcript_12414/g.21504  ORF Transcript_12414/g.21504 Transcript_12414/m.21504 type:complete len:107 (-) Transcript_12414:92-412(-)
MKKTMLAYYLKFFRDDRHKALKWMGSTLIPDSTQMPSVDQLPKIWNQLAKIPATYEGLGNKGFEKATRLNPNLNHIRTPWKLSDADIVDYRRDADMIKEDRATSDT